MSQQKKKTKNSNEYQPTEATHHADVESKDKHALGSVLFDRFEVFGIRHGGQGTVYLVEEINSHKKYAVKTFPIPPQNDSSENLRKIPDELEALIKIPFHNNIVVPLSVEYLDEVPYIVMEYIPTNLRERIGKLSFEESLLLAYQICLAMDFIHNIRIKISVLDQPERFAHVQKGFIFPDEWRNDSRSLLISEEGYVGTPGRVHIIHGDLKPENVLIDEDGVAKVSDFGMAHLFNFASGSFIQQSSGTVPYMAPEQLRGEPLDERTDVFSFGVMFYEMLQGTFPYPFDLLSLDKSKWRDRLGSFYNEIHFYNDLTPPWDGIQNPSKYPYINDLVFSCLFPAADNRSPNFHIIRRKFEYLGLETKMIFSSESNDKLMDQYKRALLLYRMGKVKESLDLFNTALVNDPNNNRIWEDAATALRSIGEINLAERFLSRANDISAKNLSDM